MTGVCKSLPIDVVAKTLDVGGDSLHTSMTGP